jgi:acetyl esterase/lipase
MGRQVESGPFCTLFPAPRAVSSRHCSLQRFGDEVLLGDSVAFAARLAEAGVSVESHVVAGMQHVWPTVFPELPESVAAMEAMARFADRVLR